MAKTRLEVLQDYLETLKAKSTQVAQEDQAPTEEAEISLPEDDTPKNGGSKNKLLKGIGYVGQKTGYGALRTIEGISDLLVGGVADLIGGENGDEFAERVMKNDWINYGRADEWYNPGTVMSTIGDAGQGFGGMLPSIALGFVPVVGPALSKAAFTAGAAGQATSEKVKENSAEGNEDALTGREWLYGGASGALESAIEWASGGIGGSKAVQGVAGKIAKKLGDGVTARLVGNFVSEGLEEVASDVADPLLQYALGYKDSFKDAYSDTSWKSLARTGIVGGLSGAAMTGLSTAFASGKAKGYNNLVASERAQQLEEQQAKANKKQAKGKGEDKIRTNIIQTAAENLSKRLQKMNDLVRTQFLESHRDLAYMFNADGTLVEGTVSTPAETTGRAKKSPIADSTETTDRTNTQNDKVRQKANVGNVATPQGGNVALPQTQGGVPTPQGGVTNAPTIGSTNASQSTPTIGGTANAQVNMGGGQVVAPTSVGNAVNNNATVQGAGGVMSNPTAVNGVNTSVNASVDNSVGNTNTRVNTADFNTDSYSAALKGFEANLAYKPISNTSTTTRVAKDVMNTLTKLTDGKANIVLTEDLIATEDGQKANGLYKDGVIYLDANATDYQKALFTGVHEVVHTLEGTKAYNDLAKFIAETISKSPALQGKYGYEKYRTVYDSILEGDWSEITKDYQASTEIFADFVANEIAVDPKIVRSIAARNRGIVVRLLNWVRNSIAKLGRSSQENAMRKELTKLEKLFADALEAGTGGRTLEGVEQDARAAEKAHMAEEAQKKNAPQEVQVSETVDNKSTVGYNKAQARASVKITNYLSAKDVGALNYKRVGEKVNTLYQGVKSGVANGIALEVDDNVYFVDADKEVELDWGIARSVKILDPDERDLFIENINLEAAENGYVDNQFFEKLGIDLDKYSGGNVSGVQRKNAQNTKGTSTNNQKSVSQTNGDKRVQVRKTQVNLSDTAYANIVKNGNMAKAQKMVDEAAKEAGYDKKRFHETKEENIIHVFNLDLNTNASADYGTPFGVFTKRHNRSVGLGGKQMSLYVKADRTFSVKDRTETPKRLPQEYSAFVDKINAIDAEYDAKYEKSSDDLLDSFAEWLDENDANDEMRNAWDVTRNLEEQFGDVLPKELIEKERKFLKVHDEWTNKTNQAILDAKKWLTKWLRDNGYDSMELEFDNGAGNRVTDALIVLDKEQVKSADPATYDNNGNLIPLSKRFNKKSADIRYSLPVDVESDVKKHYGSTYNWKETGYILQDGTRLDLSGRNEGARGGYRQVDHRDIFAIFEDGDYSYGTEALVEFMGRGNIRVMPETPGINLQVEPNAEQYRLIQDFVERVGWKEGYFSVDIDNKNGDTIETLTYEGKPSGRKVVADIKYYYKEGKVPYKSKLSDFRYSIDVDKAVKSLEGIESKYEPYTKYLALNEGKDYIRIRNINVKEEYRNKGIGQKILNDVMSYADSKGKTITLTPTKEFGTYARLKEWYTKNGFVYNAGKNADLSISDTMYRLPKKGTVGRANLDVDKAYLEAVEKNNTSAMEKMVAQAAKDAGYNSQKLYHGTEQFGFTNIKTMGVEEGVDWSPFFATNNPKVAETYSGQSGVRKIGKKDSKVPPKETLHELTQRAKDSIGQSKLWWTGEIRTRENVNAVLSRYRSIMDDIDVENLRTGKQGVWAANGFKDVNRKGDKTKFKFIPLQEGYTFKDYAPKEGNYELYANTKNLLVVEGKGAQWNNIDSDYGKTTRQISEKARDLGYSGTLFKNIVDLGFWADSKDMPNGASDVYVFFNPESQVKSADPVTYDNNGNVIPLSERFKSNKTDIRFSLDVDLDEKTSNRVQTVVHKESVQEVWDRITKELHYGIRNKWLEMQISLTDEQAGIVHAGRNLGLNVQGEIQRARSSKAAAQNMITYKQVDYNGKVVGESLRDIFKPIQKKGQAYAQKFNEYLLHQLNVDRMSAVERGLAENNKPVFEEKVDKAFSLEKIQQLEKQFPSFKEAAEKVWKYSKNLLQYRVDAGLITQAQADQMNKMYPHYVPAYYDTSKISKSGASAGKSGIAVRTGIKSAKGSSGKSDLIDVAVSMSMQTESVVKAAAINKLVTKLYDKAVETKTFIDLDVAGKEKLTDPDVNYDDTVTKGSQIAFYKDGERITLDISEYMYAGFDGLGAYHKADISPLESAASKGMNTFKKLVTSANPFFAVRNAARDFTDAWFHTKYNGFTYILREVKSFFRFATKLSPNSEYKKLWDTYVAMGGFSSGYYDSDVGVYDKRGPVRRGFAKLIDLVERANNYVEQTPRFAEFVASVKAGNSYERALYDSAEVTTNFSRGGKLTKKLNRSLIPFLNPAVQGWSKEWRMWVDPMDRVSEKKLQEMSKTSKGRLYLSMYGQLVMKIIALGLGAAALNDLLYGGLGDEDEEYAKIPINIKENNFLIRTDNGKFIKIPKGRVIALYGQLATRILDYNNGNEEALDAWDWFKSSWDMISPIEAASRSLFAPIGDVIANRTWYGTPIESRTMEQMYAAKDRYDESTSKIAIAIGQALKVSPKKVHYILDQYSGVIGDIVLPRTTEKAEQSMWESNFIVDTAYTNNVSTKYYDLKDELTYAKNSGDLTALMALKYLNASDNLLSDIYKAKRDIANYNTLSAEEKKLLISTLPTLSEQLDLANKTSLTDTEKREYTDILQALLNGTMAQLTENIENFEDIAIKNGFAEDFSKFIYSDMYTEFDESKKSLAYNKAMDYYYAKYMSEMKGEKLEVKYTLYEAAGANNTALYLAEIAKIESDQDRNGKTIAGSRKKKVEKYLQSQKLSAQQKNILLYLAGYTPTDMGKGTIMRYLIDNGYSRKEVNDLWN